MILNYILKIRIPMALSLMFFSANLHAQITPFEHYKIDIHSKRVNFFETIEHIEIIRLEETAKSLLPAVWWYLKTPNGIAIPVKKNNKVYLFDDNGDYKSSISNFGLGPDEYDNIGNVWFKDGQFELFTGRSRKLQFYTETGNYLKTIRAGFGKELWGGTMVPYGQGYLFQALDPSPKSKADYSLIFTDSQLNITSRAMPAKNPRLFGVNLGKRFGVSGNNLLYKKMLTDSVYYIDNNRKLFPAFKFDFGENWAWSDPRSNTSLKNAMNVVVHGDKVYEVLPDIGEKYIVLTYYYELRKTGMGFVNRETGKFSRFDLRKKDKENYDIKFLQWEKDRLVTSIQAYDFEEFVENLHDDQFIIRGGFRLEDILSSENPVLMKIKFK